MKPAPGPIMMGGMSLAEQLKAATLKKTKVRKPEEAEEEKPKDAHTLMMEAIRGGVSLNRKVRQPKRLAT